MEVAHALDTKWPALLHMDIDWPDFLRMQQCSSVPADSWPPISNPKQSASCMKVGQLQPEETGVTAPASNAQQKDFCLSGVHDTAHTVFEERDIKGQYEA